MSTPPRLFEVPDSDIAELESMMDDERLSDKVKLRCRIVLLRADMLTPVQVARELDRSRQFVHKWLKRYEEYGIVGLQEHRRGTGQIGRRIARKSLRHEADKLLKRKANVSWLDLERLLLTQIRSIDDDPEGSQNASRARARNDSLKLLVDVKKSQEKDGGTADDYLDEL